MVPSWGKKVESWQCCLYLSVCFPPGVSLWFFPCRSYPFCLGVSVSLNLYRLCSPGRSPHAPPASLSPGSTLPTAGPRLSPETGGCSTGPCQAAAAQNLTGSSVAGSEWAAAFSRRITSSWQLKNNFFFPDKEKKIIFKRPENQNCSGFEGQRKGSPSGDTGGKSSSVTVSLGTIWTLQHVVISGASWKGGIM